MDVSVGWTHFLLFISLNRALGDCTALSFKLNDGNEIPAVALGTSLGHLADGTRVLPVNHSLARAVQWALEAGYRHVDTATLYRVEDEVGLGLHEFLASGTADRASLYITTKLWNDAHERDEVPVALRNSLTELKLDYVDLYLMHYPMAYTGDCTALSFKLNDGNEIPAVALGTSLGHLADGTRVLPVNHSLARAVQWALEAGYRHVDTATLYRVEDEVGLGLHEFLASGTADRASLYITTKLWNDAHERDEVPVALRNSLTELKLDYVDLYLMHYPMAYTGDCTALSFKLNDGNEIPAVALGTSLGHLADGTRVLPVNHSLARAVQWALEAGYRHVDTATLYRVEDEVGLGLHEFLASGTADRASLYITTKLWNDAHERDEVPVALRNSLTELKLDYVDLYLMHYPMAYTKNGTISLTDYLTTWQGMEDVKELNLTRSIGVSNFNLTQMQRLWDNCRIKPAVLQLEVNPTITQDELVNWCRDHGVVVMAYSPFGAILGRKQDAPPPKADHPILMNLAQKYNKTVPQILLRYLLDRDLVAIPRSTNQGRIRQNIDIYDFALTSDEVALLSKFNSNFRLRTPAKWYPHPHFPFEKKNLTDAEIQYIIEHSVED